MSRCLMNGQEVFDVLDIVLVRVLSAIVIWASVIQTIIAQTRDKIR